VSQAWSSRRCGVQIPGRDPSEEEEEEEEDEEEENLDLVWFYAGVARKP